MPPDPSLILKETFMVNIFQQYRNELPPFGEYWQLIYHKKQMKVVSRTDGTSVVHYKRIRRRLFHPTKRADKQTTKLVVELSEIATEALVRELLDEKKLLSKIELCHLPQLAWGIQHMCFWYEATTIAFIAHC